VQVLARAAQMLRALSGAPEGPTSNERAGRVGLPRATAYRIVVTAVEVPLANGAAS
jgi:DNA-binding IclR family transcriptional regulator